jgi:hypothetical protein
MKTRSWILTLFALCGCQSVTDGAKQQFSEDHTCPLERIEVRARPELKPSQFRSPSAPAEVAADPARLRLWQAKQAELAENVDSWGEIVEVRGCGVQLFYSCGHPTRSSDGRRWMCSAEAHVPDTISKW